MESTYSVYSPLNKKFFHFKQENDAIVFFKEFIGDAALLQDAKIIEQKQYASLSFHNMVHSGLFLSDMHNDKMRTFPTDATINHYERLLPIFKDPAKGIILIGPYGVGKTTACQIFSWALAAGWIAPAHKWNLENAGTHSFSILDCFELRQSFALKGYQGLMDMNVLSISNQHTCIDNIRPENLTALHMGNRVNVIAEIFESRYHSFTKFGFKTHLVTILVPGQLKELFGNETFDRICQMGTLYIMDGNSNR